MIERTAIDAATERVFRLADEGRLSTPVSQTLLEALQDADEGMEISPAIVLVGVWAAKASRVGWRNAGVIAFVAAVIEAPDAPMWLP